MFVNYYYNNRLAVLRQWLTDVIDNVLIEISLRGMLSATSSLRRAAAIVVR
jgi:hypothetical protein